MSKVGLNNIIGSVKPTANRNKENHFDEKIFTQATVFPQVQR